jgi:hypothetical protein
MAPKEEAEPWRNSKAKAAVKALIESDEYYWKLSEKELHKTSELFQQYDEKRFVSNVKSLKKSIMKETELVSFQENALKNDRKLFPKKKLTYWGYPRWDTHEAKRLLRKDVQEKKQTTMEPKALHQTQEEYRMDFGLGVFRKHIYQEEYAQNGRSYWMNKKKEKDEKKKAVKKAAKKK